MPSFRANGNEWAHRILVAILVWIGYYFAARLAYAFSFRPSGITVVWIPAGLLLALLILLPRHHWPFALAGAFLGNLLADLSHSISLPFAIAGGLVNGLESAVAAAVILHLAGAPLRLTSLREVLILVIGGAVLSNAATALLGALVLTAGPESSYVRGWFVWWIGDGMGMLIVAPVILAWAASWPLQKPRGRDLIEAGVLLAGLVVVADLVLEVTPRRGTALSASPYMTYPFLFWAGLRFGPAGSATGTLVLAGVTALHAAKGTGPFAAAAANPLDPVIEAYAFLSLASISSLLPAAILSERRQAEQRLRESELHYRALFEGNPHPMWIYDPDSLAFLAVNHAAVQHYGYSADEFLGMTLRDIRPPEDVAELLRDAPTAPGGIHRGYWRHRKRDGKVFDVEVVSHPVSWAGRRARLVLALDITERKQLQEQLLQSQKMEAVGRLAGGIAHDFNNLLGIIIGYAEMARSSLPPGSPVRPRLEEIEAAGERAAALTRQLLAFSRRQVIEPRVIEVDRLVAGFTGMLERTLGENIRLVTVLPEGLGRVRADPGQIEQVLMNLAVNARDAMPGGGLLTIEAANTTLDESYAREHFPVVPGEYVMMAVTDTGIGMAPEVQKHIFEPFFTTKEPGKGTGLGLSTTYGIVKQSGGFIWVYSELGRGTTFKCYLPRVDEPATPQRRTDPPASLDGTETVLLVEDATGLRELARESLSARGYRVLTADKVADALELSQRLDGPIELLVTDMVLPDGGGAQLAATLTQDRPGLRVLYISGYTDHAITHEGMLPPGTSFLQKPFSLENLWRKVREILDQPRPA